MRKRSTWLNLLLSVLLLAGCSATQPPATGEDASANPTPKDGGSLVISALIEPETLDITKATWIDDAAGIIYEPLITRDFEGEIVPRLAESYHISDDGKVWTFKLRKDVTFHTGEPLTAEAVKLTMERFLKTSSVAVMAGPIEKVEAPDAQTVHVYFKEPFAPFMAVVTTGLITAMDPKRLNEVGEKFGENPSSTGPVIFEKQDRGASVTYKKNPDYHWGPSYVENKGPLHVDQVKFRFLKDDDTRILEFKRGTIQVLYGAPFNYVQELQSLPGVEIHRATEMGMKYIGFNNANPMFKDVRVRQAIAKAIDREPIIQVALSGFAKPVYGPLAKNIFGYSEKVENMAKEMYVRDVEKSKRLLADAGWTDMDGDGIVEKDGKPFSFELLVTAEPYFQRTAQILQSQLKEVGIDLKIHVNDVATLKEKAVKRNFDTYLLYYGWYDADILNLQFGKDGQKRMHYENKEVQDLLAKGRSTLNEAERLKIYEQVQEILVKESPWIPLFSTETITATNGINGFKLHGYYSNMILNDVRLTK
ncbi:ABC transporter substrate-binding protein [Brevibacillus reuszeri]|uniref:ABC transporter substrate-binding protein n=1 Tax=Brevibacillus reuszeri TaxID=54915 RepID=UPI003D192D5D